MGAGRVRSGATRRSVRGRGRRASTTPAVAARAARWRGRSRRRARRARSRAGRARRRAPGTTAADRAAPPTSAISSIALPVNVSTGRQQPREVVRDAFDDGAGQVAARRLERHVHEAAAHRRCRSAARSRPPSQGRNMTPPAPARGGARARGRARRTGRRRGGRRARRPRRRGCAARARAPCRRARSPRTRRSGRDTARASRRSGGRGRRGTRRPRRPARSSCRSRCRRGPGANAPVATAAVAVSFVPAYTVADAGSAELARRRRGAASRPRCRSATSGGRRVGVDARELHELVVVRGRVERAVVAQLVHERAVLARGDAAGQRAR